MLAFLPFNSVCMLQIVLENSSREDKHECPFGRSSIELTKMLCEILKVGELRKCLYFKTSSYRYHVPDVFIEFLHFGFSSTHVETEQLQAVKIKGNIRLYNCRGVHKLMK